MVRVMVNVPVISPLFSVPTNEYEYEFVPPGPNWLAGNWLEFVEVNVMLPVEPEVGASEKPKVSVELLGAAGPQVPGVMVTLAFAVAVPETAPLSSVSSISSVPVWASSRVHCDVGAPNVSGSVPVNVPVYFFAPAPPISFTANTVPAAAAAPTMPMVVPESPPPPALAPAPVEAPPDPPALEAPTAAACAAVSTVVWA